MDVFIFAQNIGKLLDLAGVCIILLGIVISTVLLASNFFHKENMDQIYNGYRKHLGKSILLGLEFLVAGDIIRSVTGQPNFTSVIVLAIIVLIRSFLGITFEWEVNGRLPWHRGRRAE